MYLPTLLASLLMLASCNAAAEPRLAPPFDAPDPAAWINSAPLTPGALLGKVVLIEFWTFGCSNCRNTLPWLKWAAARPSLAADPEAPQPAAPSRITPR